MKLYFRLFIFSFLAVVLIAFGFLFMEKNTDFQTLQLSSFAEKLKEVRATEYETINRLTDQQVLKELEKTKVKWTLNGREEYSVSPEEVEKIGKRHKKQLPKKFRDNPAFRFFEQINQMLNQKAQITPEDPAQCGPERQVEFSPRVKELLFADSQNDFESKLAKKCVTHIMNHFGFPGIGYANCQSTTGNPKISGFKPCVTESLVDLTYNSYMNVADCLDVDPKFLISKIDFESGFLSSAVNRNQLSGLGQLNREAIAEVNHHFDEYIHQIEKAAPAKRSCANLLLAKDLLNRAVEGSEQRCSMIGLPENPLRNIFYMAVLNKINQQKIESLLVQRRMREKLEQLGLKNPDMHSFTGMLALAAASIGFSVTADIFTDYVDKRIANQLMLTAGDFDFGNSKNLVNEARDYVMSSFIGPKDTPAMKLEKAKKRKEFPRLWATSFTRTFPEHLAYQANTYDGKNITYSVLGFPGYLNLVAERNRAMRDVFENSGLDPNLCSDPDFLKLAR